MNPKSLCHIVGRTTCFAKFSILVFFFSLSINSFGYQAKAFPSVKGAGSYTEGGRGGIVVKVTNLNNSGSGSLRSALMMTVPRTIVFEVSGTIVLTSSIELILENSNFTVAGQTAPEGGITISNHLIQMGGGYYRPTQPCNNAIWRYVRFRNGRYNGQPDVREHNGFICTGSVGLVFDHCSFSFCDDQAMSLGGDWGDIRNVTIQNCVFSENATGVIIGLNPNYPTGDITSINNLYVDQGHRTPNAGGTLQYDIINNIFFNWKSRLVNANAGSPEINFIGNYLKPGSFTLEGSANKVQNINGDVYTANNFHPTYYPTPQLDDRNLWQNFYTNAWLSNSHFTTTIHPLLENTTIQSAEEAYAEIISSVGADKYINADGSFGVYRDSFDVLKIANVENNISSDPANKNWTLPTLPINTRPSNYDSDNDGMADTWETENGLNINDASDRNIVQTDGYTNLEYFLNGMTLETSANQVNVTAVNDILCEGQNTTLTASGADSYAWNTGETSANLEITPDVTTTYTVTGTHSDGSTTEAEITITVNQNPTANAGQDVDTCLGTAVTLTAIGGTSYLWDNGATTASINVNPNNTTTYMVEVFENNCSSTDEVIVTVNETPDVDAGEDQTIFEGQSATLIATGADSYVWSTGETTESITVNPLLDTSYFVTGTTNTCENTDTVTVFLLDDSVNANAGADTEICIGESITLTATGGTTYVWNTGETTASIQVSPTEITTYTVTAYSVSGANFEDDSVIVAVNEIPVANAGEDVEICFGNVTTLTASGGTTYVWSTGETTETITVNPDGTTTYSVEATTNNCSSTDDIIVTVNDLPETNAGSDISIFEGDSTTLTASGADSYLWNTGETTTIITVSPTSTTTYTVTGDSNGCQSIDDVIVSIMPDDVTANAGEDITICEGESITLTASGGSTYIWNTGETTASIEVSPTATTTYTVTAYSMSGNNTDADSIEVTVNELPIADAGEDVEICFGNSTTITASGGTTYLWSTGETTATITVNPYNTTIYTVEVFENNCSSIDQTQVTVNALPETYAGSNVSITEGESVTLTATGADFYVWSTGETTTSITVSPTSTLMYFVTGNSNGCESTDNVIVFVGTEAVNANAGADVAICNGESTTLSATGGTTYLWNTGETTASIAVNPNQTTVYTVTAFNEAETASDDDSVTVTINELPETNAGNDVSIIEGETTILTASGANSYVWSTGETTASITVSPTSTTAYSVTGNSNGCESSDSVTVSVGTEAVNANAGANVAMCNGESTTLTATGGATYLWNTGETTASITVNPNQTTVYTVTAFNEAETASDDDSVTVTINDLPETNAGSDISIIEGDSTILTASGADSYLWSTGETTTSITVSPTSTTTYTVTGNSNGCELSDDVIVSVGTENINANAGADVAICNGESITLTATGGANYLWDTGETTASIEVSPIATTTYTVIAFSANGSESNEDSVTVTVNDLPQTYAGTDVTIIEGDFTTLIATGADSYVWSTGETTSSITVNPTATSTYTVTGVSNGCESIDEINVTVELFIYLASAGANQTICQGYETTLTASEGDSYLWSTGETTQSITVNPTNTQTYTVTVFEGDYQAEAEVEVGVNPNPNVVITNGNDVMILEGEFVTLSANGANTYMWNNGATQPNIAVSPSITTTYEVTGFINNCEDTTAIIVNVLEIVEADAGEDLIICEEETVTLTATGGDEYLWNNGETTQIIEVSPNVDTEYSVLVYNALDSDEDSIMVFVEECSTIELPIESEAFDFVIYQDPTTDILKVRIDGLQTVTARGYSIFDLSGKVIYTEIFNPAEMEELSQMTRELDVSTYSRGVYVVRLIYDDTSLIKKIPIR